MTALVYLSNCKAHTTTGSLLQCAPDGSVGTPYVLARGKSLTIISDIKLTPLDATNPVGTQHTVTAKVTKNDPAPGTPVVGTEVKFEIIAGPHIGLTGTDLTDAAGEATFTYTGTIAGTDIIEATFKDAAGLTQRSNRVTKLWVKAAGPCDDLNGGFERGPQGLADCWTLSSILDGISRVEDEGSCFGANNTKGITFVDSRIQNKRALNVRSSAPAPEGSIGIATSDPFTFGTAIHFKALSENDDAIPAPGPVYFEWRLLNAAGDTVLASDDVTTNILTTSPGTSNDGCLVGDVRDGAFSSHVIETEKLAGQTGRLQFIQHTEVEGKGFFTLVDDVSVVVSPASKKPATIPSSGPRVGPNPNR